LGKACKIVYGGTEWTYLQIAHEPFILMSVTNMATPMCETLRLWKT
jgi:hypothetical protein